MASKFKAGPLRKGFNALIAVFIERGIAPRGGYLLTTIGRKSGKPLTHPVQLIIDGDERWLVAPYGEVAWVHNARAAGKVRLQRGRDDREWTIHELPATQAAPILKRYVRIAPVVLPYFDAKLTSPVETFEAEADRHPVFRLEPIARADR